MNSSARWIVAAVMLVFAWRGAAVDVRWPPAWPSVIKAPQPPAEVLKWATPVKAILPKMLPDDRAYLEQFYDAVAWVVMQDGDREQPIISNTERWVQFHSGSLRLAIERDKVGRYPGLGEAIDETFFNAIGGDVKELDKATRERLVAACGVLSWSFAIHADE